MKYPLLVSMPSAVSYWLEEQLEARGIDSQVYTRYILSLLHTHTLDLIYPQNDLPLSTKKNRGRGTVSHKHKRHTGLWWTLTYADAEQIKRSAAVECLMSAAGQSYEIESLVDELCKKLKEVNSEGDLSLSKSRQDIKILKEPCEPRKISSKELAEEYYAAFPPLNKERDLYFTATSLTSKWPSSKKQLETILDSGTSKNTKRPKRQVCKNNMRPILKTVQNNNRLGQKRTHNGRNLTKEIEDNVTNWEFINNNNYQLKDQFIESLNPTIMTTFSQGIRISEKDEHDSAVCRMKVWLKNVESEDSSCNKNKAVKMTRSFEKKSKYIPLYQTNIWSHNEDVSGDWENGSNEDWNSLKCTSKKDTSWLLNDQVSAIRERQLIQNEVECAIKEEYDRPRQLCGHEQTTYFDGQWDINSNEASIDIGGIFSSNVKMGSPCQLENDIFNFGLIATQDLQMQGDEFIRQNIANSTLEGTDKRRICMQCSRDERSYRREESKMPFLLDLNTLMDKKTISLMKVNHSTDNSAFCEYKRPTLDSYSGQLFQSFGGSNKRSRAVTDKEITLKMAVSSPGLPEDQKCSSPDMYFEPIKTMSCRNELKQDNMFQDGTTFHIRGSPDKIKFQRTGTGSLTLETEFGELKKYFQYNWRPPSEDSFNLPIQRTAFEREKFTVKFSVSQNNKSCQTLDVAPLDSGVVEDGTMATPLFQDLHSDIIAEENYMSKTEFDDHKLCEWTTSERDTGTGYIYSDGNIRPDSFGETDEIVWGYAPRSSDVFCKYCNTKHPWPDTYIKKLGIDFNERSLKDIWGVSEACGTCPWTSKVPTPLVETTTLLREESKEEAERLLSDLSSLQLSYSSGLLENNFQSDEGPSEKKRRHSYMCNDMDLWSFATRLQENCLISLPVLQTRRSVTL